MRGLAAGPGLYSTPRGHAFDCETVEIGFPARPLPSLLPYAEDPDRQADTVYGCVPVGIVDAIIAES